MQPLQRHQAKEPLPERQEIRPVAKTSRGNRHHLALRLKQPRNQPEKPGVKVGGFQPRPPQQQPGLRVRVYLPIRRIHDGVRKAMPLPRPPEKIILIQQRRPILEHVPVVQHVTRRHARRPARLDTLLQDLPQPANKLLLGFPQPSDAANAASARAQAPPPQMRRSESPRPRPGPDSRTSPSADSNMPASRPATPGGRQKLPHPAPVVSLQRGASLLRPGARPEPAAIPPPSNCSFSACLMLQDCHNTIAYAIVISSSISGRPSALWPAPAPMPLEPLHFPILQQVVPAVLLRSQPLFLYQLPHPHRRNTQDLSGLFRSDQAHLTRSCTPRRRDQSTVFRPRSVNVTSNWTHPASAAHPKLDPRCILRPDGWPLPLRRRPSAEKL